MIDEEIAALRRIGWRCSRGPNTGSVRVAQLRVRIKRRLRRLGVPVPSAITSHELIGLARGVFKLERASGARGDDERTARG